jgi:hypothetical protein
MPPIASPFKKVESIFVFACRTQGRMEIDACGNSALLSDAAKSLQLIQSITNLRGGEIEGWLAPETSGVDLYKIPVKIRCGSRVYYAITDREGSFHFRAPKGNYKVDFSSGEYYLNRDDKFWYDPANFTLHAGETVALQLISVRHSKK